MPTHASWTCLLVLVSSVAVTGCGNTAVSARAAPLDVHLYCAGTDGQSVTCDPQERLAQFSSFVKEAMYRPHSTFTIWAVGDRSHTRRVFTACIPDHWKAPVSKSKADFLREAHEGAAGSRTGQSVSTGCAPPGTTTPGKTQLVVFPEASPLKPDVWKSVSSDPQAPIQHSSIVCDRSPSTLGTACTPGALLRLFDMWITESLLRPGATFSVEMVGTRDTGPIFHLTVPSDPLGERIAYVLGSRLELSRLISAQGETYTSTIIEAINAAVRRLRERPGVYRLTVLSDMLQINGGYNFERALPAPKDFVAYLKKQNLTPDLRNISVMACGLHTGQFGPNSAARAARLQEIWRLVFQSMGADPKLFSQCEAAFAA